MKILPCVHKQNRGRKFYCMARRKAKFAVRIAEAECKDCEYRITGEEDEQKEKGKDDVPAE